DELGSRRWSKAQIKSGRRPSAPCFSLPTGRKRGSLRSAARDNAFDSNRFHKRFHARRQENNRKLVPLIRRITDAEGRIRFRGGEFARRVQMNDHRSDNK